MVELAEVNLYHKDLGTRGFNPLPRKAPFCESPIVIDFGTSAGVRNAVLNCDASKRTLNSRDRGNGNTGTQA
jgi:hypothetical protein